MIFAAAGFAQMAWELAWERKMPPATDGWMRHPPVERAQLTGTATSREMYPASAEYYRIVDKAASFALPLMPNEIPGCRLVTL